MLSRKYFMIHLLSHVIVNHKLTFLSYHSKMEMESFDGLVVQAQYLVNIFVDFYSICWIFSFWILNYFQIFGSTLNNVFILTNNFLRNQSILHDFLTIVSIFFSLFSCFSLAVYVWTFCVFVVNFCLKLNHRILFIIWRSWPGSFMQWRLGWSEISSTANKAHVPATIDNRYLMINLIDLFSTIVTDNS